MVEVKIRRRQSSAGKSYLQKSLEKLTSVILQANLAAMKEFPSRTTHSASRELLDYVWATRLSVPLKTMSSATRNSCRNVPIMPRADLIHGQLLSSKYQPLDTVYKKNNPLKSSGGWIKDETMPLAWVSAFCFFNVLTLLFGWPEGRSSWKTPRPFILRDYFL